MSRVLCINYATSTASASDLTLCIIRVQHAAVRGLDIPAKTSSLIILTTYCGTCVNQSSLLKRVQGETAFERASDKPFGRK